MKESMKKVIKEYVKRIEKCRKDIKKNHKEPIKKEIWMKR